MEWLEALTLLLDAVAWPAVATVALLLLRKPLSGLISRLLRADTPLGKYEFQEQVEAVAERFEKSTSAGGRPSGGDAVGEPTDDARARVLTAWLEVEAAISDLAQRSGIDVAARPTIGKILVDLARQGTISRETRSVIEQMRGLRNDAVHRQRFELSRAAAHTYQKTAEEIAQLLNALGANGAPRA